VVRPAASSHWLGALSVVRGTLESW